MSDQLELFASPPSVPEGFRYQPELITREAERALLNDIAGLPFKEFEFHGYVGKRRTVSFGWSYDFSRESLQATEDMPAFLRELRQAAAVFGGVDAAALTQVLVTEYGPGAGIGWHRDKAVFGDVVGISLRSACRFRFRREADGKWERVSLDAAPRSAYLLRGPARDEWEHSIAPVEELRYSITYRSLRSSS